MLRLCTGLWFYRVFAVLAALAFVVGITLTLTGDASLGLPTIGVAIVWSLLTAGSLFVGPVLQYRRQPRLRDEQSHCFADDGITVSFADAESHLKWTFYEVLAELDDVYLLRHQKRFANIIPRRAFSSREDENRFRQLAQQHMKVEFRPQAATA